MRFLYCDEELTISRDELAHKMLESIHDKWSDNHEWYNERWVSGLPQSAIDDKEAIRAFNEMVESDALLDLKAIFNMQRRREVERVKPEPEYIRKIQTMEENWRPRYGTWMLSLAESYGLVEDTVDAALYIFDRYFSGRTTVSIAESQKIVIVAMVIASRFYDVDPMTISEAVSVAPREEEFSRSALVATQLHLLALLDNRVAGPSAYMFARDFTDVLTVIASSRGTPIDPDTLEDFRYCVSKTLNDMIIRTEAVKLLNSSMGITAVIAFWTSMNLGQELLDLAITELGLKDYAQRRECMELLLTVAQELAGSSDRPPSPVAVDEVDEVQRKRKRSTDDCAESPKKRKS